MSTQAVAYNERLTLRLGIAVLSKLVCALTLILIFVGALVTSNNAGLAVPDWPTSFGYNMFTFPRRLWLGGIFYEHTHRLLASTIGLLTLLLTIGVLLAEQRRWVRVLSVLTLLAVCVQGALGGLTVLLQLPAAVSVAHGVLGQTFFLLTLCLAYALSSERQARLSGAHRSGEISLARGALVAAALVYAQLILGAIMRHTESGLAIPDFPTMAGALLPHFDSETLATLNGLRQGLHLPPVEMSQVFSHLAHRLGGVVVAMFVVVFAVRSLLRGSNARQLNVSSLLWAALGLVILQFGLGILTVLTVRNPVVTSLHVMGGALLLGLLTFTSLRSFPLARVAADNSRGAAK